MSYFDHQPKGVLGEIADERARQDARWGEQNHRDGTGGFARVHDAMLARQECQRQAADATAPDATSGGAA